MIKQKKAGLALYLAGLALSLIIVIKDRGKPCL